MQTIAYSYQNKRNINIFVLDIIRKYLFDFNPYLSFIKFIKI